MGLPRDESEIDGTLVEALLGLTPEARLRMNDRVIADIEEVRRAFAARRDAAARPDESARGPRPLGS